jgi:PAS domain S-box-containing protein
MSSISKQYSFPPPVGPVLKSDETQRMRRALDAAGLGMYTWHVPSDTAWWHNDRLFSLFGRDPDKGAMGFPEMVRSCLHPEDRTPFESALDASLKNGTHFHTTARSTCQPNEPPRQLEFHGDVEYGADGEAEYLFGVIQDHGAGDLSPGGQDRLHALASAAADQRFLMDLSDALSLLSDPMDMMRTVGRRVLERFGVSRCVFVDYAIEKDLATVPYDERAEQVGTMVGEYRLSNLAPPDVLQELDRGRQIVLDDLRTDPRTAGNFATFQTMGIAASVTTPYVSDGICRHGLTVHHKEPHAWTVRELDLLREICSRAWSNMERAQIGVRLRSSLHRMRLVTDSLPVLVSYLDKDHIYRFVNRRYTEWFGITEEQILGRHLRDVVGDTVYGLSLPKIERVLSGESFSFEQLHEYKVGGPRYVLVNYVPDTGEDGRVGGWYALVQDITERKRSDEALQEAARRKDEFLATLSHELRNPLSPLRSALDILDLGVSAEEEEKARAVMKRQVDRLTHLIDDLMDLSRITGNKINLRRTVMDISGAVYEAAEAVSPQIKEEGHQLVLDLPDHPVLVLADMNRMVQMITNLLSNAVKFTDPRGLITITVRAANGSAHVSVKDNGVGIATEHMAQIFDMFSQVGLESARTRSGLGIGLHLVQNLARMHGGSIEVKSEGLGRGSEFILSLPLATAAH